MIRCILILSVALSAGAANVRLAWDASTSPGVTNYTVHVTRGTNAWNLRVGTNLTATAENLTPGLWTFEASCQAGGVSSDRTPPLLVEVPEPPRGGIRTIVVQYSETLTNFYDVGFFRLRIP